MAQGLYIIGVFLCALAAVYSFIQLCVAVRDLCAALQADLDDE